MTASGWGCSSCVRNSSMLQRQRKSAPSVGKAPRIESRSATAAGPEPWRPLSGTCSCRFRSGDGVVFPGTTLTTPAYRPGALSGGYRGARVWVSTRKVDDLKTSIGNMFFGASWRSYRVHWLCNLLTHVPKGHTELVAAAIRTIFSQPSEGKSMPSSTPSPCCSDASFRNSRLS